MKCLKLPTCPRADKLQFVDFIIDCNQSVISGTIYDYCCLMETVVLVTAIGVSRGGPKGPCPPKF